MQNLISFMGITSILFGLSPSAMIYHSQNSDNVSENSNLVFKVSNINQISDFGLNHFNNDLYFIAYKHVPDSSLLRQINSSLFVLPAAKQAVTAFSSINKDSIYPYLMSFDNQGNSYIGTVKAGVYKIPTHSYAPAQDKDFPVTEQSESYGA